MAGRAWWATAIQWAVWSVAMTLVMGWLARSRLRPHGQNAGVLEHPASTLIIGVVCTLFFCALAVLSFLFPGRTGSGLVSLTFLGFALLGVLLIAEYVRVRYSLQPGGLHYTPLLSRSWTLRWGDVTGIRYSQAAKWFRIDTGSGRVVRVSAMLTGLPEFAQAVLREVPPSRIDADALPILEQTAGGNPPSIWTN
jgi:PH (Pleckstrin Homology) domain-containing protein